MLPSGAAAPAAWQCRPLLRALLVAAGVCFAATSATAQPVPATPAAGQPSQSGVLALLPADVVTEHLANLGGETLSYGAKAGTFTLFDQAGERTAAIFHTAYTLNDAAADTRPVTFVFNGGPGAASAYLHLGLVGPRIADFGDRPDGATARLEHNPDSWLKFTDLVLIDPVGTGWSRAAAPDKADGFWGVEQDAQALAKVIALYLAETGRMASPAYLLGESYGGFRAAKVARALQRDQGIVVRGIVMVSPFLEGALHFGAGRLALNAALLLPSIAATELDRQGRFSAEALASAERFAMTDYLVTLAGRAPDEEIAADFYGRVAELSGLPVDVVARVRGFVRRVYLTHARDARQEVVSPYDATYAAPDPFPESDDGRSSDPILDGYLQSLGGLFVGYTRDQLGFKTPMTYMLLNREVSRKWRWNGGSGGRRNASASGDLRELLALNPSFRLLIGHGRSDLVTPYAVSRYVLDHLPETIAPERAQLAIYKGGHMFYFDSDSRAAFSAAAEAFYRNGLRENEPTP